MLPFGVCTGIQAWSDAGVLSVALLAARVGGQKAAEPARDAAGSILRSKSDGVIKLRLSKPPSLLAADIGGLL